jgi:hypothetical protein
MRDVNKGEKAKKLRICALRISTVTTTYLENLAEEISKRMFRVTGSLVCLCFAFIPLAGVEMGQKARKRLCESPMRFSSKIPIMWG